MDFLIVCKGRENILVGGIFDSLLKPKLKGLLHSVVIPEGESSK